MARFRSDAPAFRAAVGDAAAREFALTTLNDLICDLQDAVQPTVRAYNGLLREPGLDGGEGPPG